MGLSFPEIEGDYVFIALHHLRRYAVLEGRLHTSTGMELDMEDFEDVVLERQVAHSTALHGFIKELMLLEAYDDFDIAPVDMAPTAATAVGSTEAPRGLCWHRYRLDEQGKVLDVRIVPPTVMNFNAIETDLKLLVEKFRYLPVEQLKRLCEQLVRCYDPCISCSCH